MPEIPIPQKPPAPVAPPRPTREQITDDVVLVRAIEEERVELVRQQAKISARLLVLDADGHAARERVRKAMGRPA